MLLTFCAVAGLTIPTAPAPVSAQSKMEQARDQFRKGRSLYEEGKFEQAAEAFIEAYELSDRSELLFNIGQAYRKADELSKAEEYFQKYLNKKPNAKNADSVVETVIQIQQELAARMASLKVQTKSPGRQVFVDGESEPRCTTPCSVSITPGEHTLTLRGEGAKPLEQKVNVNKGATGTMELALEPDVAQGKLQVRSATGGGAVRVGDKGEYSLPMDQPVDVPVGEHELVLTDPSGKTTSRMVTIQQGETTRLLMGGDSGGSAGGWKRPVAYGLAGASVALLSGAAIVGSNAKTTHDILSAQQNRAGAVDSDLLAKGRREQTTANVLIGVGTTSLLSGAGLFVWDMLGGSASGSAERPRLFGPQMPARIDTPTR
jgi:hypothetical protein